MLEELEKWSHLKQQVLPFDFWEEEEAEKQAEIHNLPYYETPVTDNQRLFNLQKEYYEGREQALTEMFELMIRIAPKLVNKEMNSSKKKRSFSDLQKEELAMDAVCLFVQQIKKNRLIIKESFIAYLFLQVRKVMNTRTKAQMFESFCKRNKVNIFNLSESEKNAVKMHFELELRRQTMTDEELWEMKTEAEKLQRDFDSLPDSEKERARQLFTQKWYGYKLDEVIKQ